MTGRIRTAIIAIAATLLLVAFMLLIQRCMYPVSDRPPFRQLTVAQKADFKMRAKRHFHPRHVATVINYPDDPYFIRDGKRCKF